MARKTSVKGECREDNKKVRQETLRIRNTQDARRINHKKYNKGNRVPE